MPRPWPSPPGRAGHGGVGGGAPPGAAQHLAPFLERQGGPRPAAQADSSRPNWAQSGGMGSSASSTSANPALRISSWRVLTNHAPTRGPPALEPGRTICLEGAEFLAVEPTLLDLGQGQANLDECLCPPGDDAFAASEGAPVVGVKRAVGRQRWRIASGHVRAFPAVDGPRAHRRPAGGGLGPELRGKGLPLAQAPAEVDDVLSGDVPLRGTHASASACWTTA
jgi:hypothetical protein